MLSTARTAGLALAAALFALTGCQGGGAEPAAAGPGEARVASVAPAASGVTYDEHGQPVGLHQFNPYTDHVTSGAQPDGDEAFRNLAALGFRTIVSVDGALPDVAGAEKHGLRYVHVPTQYSGMKPAEIAQVASAIHASDGPVYVHCHHGKHRSPAATGAACVALGLVTNEQALEEMKTSGTDPKYEGLFRDVAAQRPYTPEELAALPDASKLPSAVRPGDLATAMVDVDLRWEHLKAVKAADWGVPPSNPDVDPPHEAMMLWEHFNEIARLPDARQCGDDFEKWVTQAQDASKALEDAIRAKDAAAAAAAFERNGKTCAGCHKKYRDN